MVSRRDKNRAVTYICGLLEESGLYVIQRADIERGVRLREKADVREEPRNISVLIPNFMGRIDNFTSACQSNVMDSVYTASVLYKDGNSAFVRMVERNSSWRTNKSLKRYTPQQINQMIHLRGIEKRVLDSFPEDRLAYFQPETERLSESLKEFDLTPVILDYSHVDRFHQAHGFVEDRESIDYKLPVETEVIMGSGKIVFWKNDYRKRAKITNSKKMKKGRLF